jgi:HD superfamily phosphohydrolase
MGPPMGIDYLREYVHFIEGTVAIDEKVVDHAAEVQTFYMRMYKEVYLRKSLVIAQRMFHKAVYHLIRCGELAAESLISMIDEELLGCMFFSRDPTVRRFYKALRERDFFCEAVSIRPQASACETRVAGKPICVIGSSEREMNALVRAPLLQKRSHAALEHLEEMIAREVGLPEQSVLVVPVFNPERFQPKDVKIYGSTGKLHSLRERRPSHYARMEELAQSYVALRICTPKECRVALSAAGPLVHDLVISEMQ